MGRLSSQLDQEDTLVDEAVSESLGQLESELAISGEHFIDAIEDRLGHVEVELVAEPDAPERKAVAGTIRRPTQKTLRRAVVMNEVLGLPIALRQPGSLGPRHLL